MHQRARSGLAAFGEDALCSHQAAAICLHLSNSASVWWMSTFHTGCPMAFSLIWSESHLMALQQLCIFTDAELLSVYSRNEQSRAEWFSSEMSHSTVTVAQLKPPYLRPAVSPPDDCNISHLCIYWIFLLCNTVFFLLCIVLTCAGCCLP